MIHFYTVLASLITLSALPAVQAPVVTPEKEDVAPPEHPSAIYRGQGAPQYSYSFNGTPYLDNKGFSKGDVFFDGRFYRDVDLDVNAHAQELLVREKPGYLPVAPKRELVAWFTRGGMLFVNLRYSGLQYMPEGYYQQLVDAKGARWYCQIVKRFTAQVGDFNDESGIGYVDPSYKVDVIDYFQVYRNYYTLDKKTGQYVKAPKRKVRRAQLSADMTLPAPNDNFAAARVFPNTALNLRFTSAQGLPPGWFSSNEKTEQQLLLQQYVDQDNMIAQTRNKTYVVGMQGKGVKNGLATVSGCVRDVATGELLQAVLVSDAAGKIYTYTDEAGRYSLDLPLGENTILLSAYSKEDMKIHVQIEGAGGLDLIMRDEVKQLQSAYVTADTRAEHRRTSMGLERMSSGVLKKIPTAFGEADVLKAVLTLPGVKTVGEASSGFNVRGGSADQNLILYDESTIFNPSHLFGIFSAFNPDAVDGIELYKSTVPARYGGRISSVLEVRSKEGNLEKIHGSLGVGILTSHAQIEGPIKKGKTSFALGGRTTYSNWILKMLPASSGYSGGKAGFFDVNASLSHHFNDRDKLQAFAYYSRDHFSFTSDTTFRYSNLNAALKYTHRNDSGLSYSVSAGYDGYGNNVEDGVKADNFNSYSLSTRINQAFTRVGFDYKAGAHAVNFGAEGLYYRLQPGSIVPGSPQSITEPSVLALQTAVQPSIYAGDVWSIGESPFSLDYGVRLSSYVSLESSKMYAAPELRVGGKYSPGPNLSIKAGWSNMTQYLHMISNTAGISPMDTWQLCSDNVLPQKGWQGAGGAYWTLADGGLDLSLEAYYKNIRNYLDYRSGAVLQMNPDLVNDLVRTKCRAYGIEVMAKKTMGHLTGWISYTYSRALLKDIQNEGLTAINEGAWYPAAHDKPHDIKLVCNYAFTHRYSLSVNLDYSTGRPVTIPVGKYHYDGTVRLAYSTRNGYRIPDYFRMDLAFNIDPGHYLKAFTHASCTIGCYNVTGRKNAYSVYYSTNGGSSVHGYMLSVFATQVPYVTLNLKF